MTLPRRLWAIALWSSLGPWLALPASANGIPADLELVELTTVDGAVAIRAAGDGSQRLFIVRRSGTIVIFDLASEMLLPEPFLDIEDLVEDGGGEQGLLGLAFAPDYATSGLFYVSYLRAGADKKALDRSVLARYQVSAADPNVADAETGLVFFELEQPRRNHNGGDIHFGPDGYLYLSLGDGGGGFDPNMLAQDRSALHGSILRLDVAATGSRLGSSGGEICGLVGDYAIPVDNPYAGADGWCDEIWAYGLRNPWRISFDRATGDLYIGDVGQFSREEVDMQPAASAGGENYGWSCREGTRQVDYNPCALGATLIEPIADYNHNSGCAITGGFVYRGSIAGLHGRYVYGDFCSGRIWFARRDNGSWAVTEWTESGSTYPGITTFGESDDGELYLAAQNDIYRFASSGVGTIFDDCFETGDTTAWSSTVSNR